MRGEPSHLKDPVATWATRELSDFWESADFDDSGAKLVAEELHGSLGLEPALDGLIGEGRDAEGELGLGDAGLDAERLDDHVARPANRPGTSSSRMSPKPWNRQAFTIDS